MFDSRQYEFGDMSLLLGGRDVTGFRGIKYSEEAERTALFAKGRHAHSIQTGNISVKGEITLLQDEYEALIQAGNGSVLNLKGLTAVVNYGDPMLGDVPITDIVEGIHFTEGAKEMKQGDKNMEVKLPFLALRVRHQA